MRKWLVGFFFLLAGSALCADAVVWVASNANSGKMIAEGSIANGGAFSFGDLDAGVLKTIPQDTVEYFVIHPQRVSEKQGDLCFARTFADLKMKGGSQPPRGCFLTPMYITSADRTQSELQYPHFDVKGVPRK